MIEYGLFTAAGFLLAATLALMLIPFMTGRAANSAVRKLKANMPFSTAEMAAEKDQMRAEHAIELRKIEIDRGKQAERVAQQNIELREIKEKLIGVSKVSKAGKLALEEMRAKEHDLNERVRQRDAQLAGLEQRSRQMLRENRELKQLARKNGQNLPTTSDASAQHGAVKTSPSGLPVADAELAKQVSISTSTIQKSLDDERARSKRLEKQLEEARRKLSEMRAGMDKDAASKPNLPRAVVPAALGGTELKPVDVTGENMSDIRQQMTDMAVSLARVSATLEGPQSKLHQILKTVPAEDINSLGALMKAALEQKPAVSAKKTAAASSAQAKAQPKRKTESISVKATEEKEKTAADTVSMKDESDSSQKAPTKKSLSLPVADASLVPQKTEDDKPQKTAAARSRTGTPKRTASAKPRARKPAAKSTTTRTRAKAKTEKV